MSTRQQKGLQIASTKTITQTGDTWLVPSDSGNGAYMVKFGPTLASCACQDFQSNQAKCKHIFAVEYTIRINKGESVEAIRASIAKSPKRAKTRKQDKSPMVRYTVKDLKRDFPNDEACLEWLKNYRWPNGIHCKVCNRVTKHHLVISRKSYSCQECGHHVHPTAGTIYHKSSTPLTLWFHAMYLMAQTRGGISAKQVERELGVTYKTAWRIFKMIRSRLGEKQDPFGGEVECDESYFGGVRHGGKRGRGSENKVPVAGIVERKGRVKTVAVENVRKVTLEPIIRETVAPGSCIITDELLSYNGLLKLGYDHKTVKHAEKIYVMPGNVHTNTIEGHWGNVKNGIRGVYHHVSKKYLQHYLDEYQFRYNHRNDVRSMFSSFLHRVGMEVGG